MHWCSSVVAVSILGVQIMDSQLLSESQVQYEKILLEDGLIDTVGTKLPKVAKNSDQRCLKLQGLGHVWLDCLLL